MTTRATIELIRGAAEIELSCEDAGLHLVRRQLAESGDDRPFPGWAKEYAWIQRALDRSPLRQLGQQMYDWLDGGDGWLARLLDQTRPPLLIEFTVASRRLDPAEHEFLDAPWELLAGPDGAFLAELDLVRYCPIRRIGRRASETIPPSDSRLSVVFMAAAPVDLVRLSFEAEEVAILDATELTPMDLTIEESGNLTLLSRSVAERQPDVLHLSCHGTTDPPPGQPSAAPALLLEDEFGQTARATANDIALELGEHLPQRLTFVSACSTAASVDPARDKDGDGASSDDKSTEVIGSLASGLLSHGCAAVLGWAGPVLDGEATTFAAFLYKRLSNKESLESAVALARRDLIDAARRSAERDLSPTRDHGGEDATRFLRRDSHRAATDARESRDWHLARLYLGERGGGPLTKDHRRSRLPNRYDLGHKEFLDAKGHQVPVASRAEFVGRRRHLQTILREMDQHEYAGVLLHGMGRHGKSSLAARVANRLTDYHHVVVYGRYDGAAILDAIKRQTTGSPSSGRIAALIDRARTEVHRNSGELTSVLAELLNDPCYQVERDGRGRVSHRPMLLIIDDFERVLEPSGTSGYAYRVRPDLSATMRAVIEVFARADSDSRLLITSLYRFTLPDGHGGDLADTLLSVPLGPMSSVESRLQAHAKRRTLKEEPPERELEARCIEQAQGNPGLQNLLFVSAMSAPEDCKHALDGLQRYLETGQLRESMDATDSSGPVAEEMRQLLEGLVIDQLLSCLTDNERALLQVSTLFRLPVPPEIMRATGEALSLNLNTDRDTRTPPQRLLDLGLWDRYADPVDARERAYQVNPLVRPRIEELSPDSGQALAAVVARPLYDQWGGDEGARSWSRDIDRELTRLALLAGDAKIVSRTAENTLSLLDDQQAYKDGARLAAECMALLDAQEVTASVAMLIRAGRAHGSIGEVDTAKGLFERAQSRAEELGDRRSRALTLSDIARIMTNKGQVEDALKLHQEQLDVYDELGDRRSRAHTLGDIARILHDKGQVEDALKLHQEQLDVHEELGLPRDLLIGRVNLAITLWRHGHD
ncbi:MAG: CHAT domain-containing protein, partial [Myxococcota bacterium]